MICACTHTFSQSFSFVNMDEFANFVLNQNLTMHDCTLDAEQFTDNIARHDADETLSCLFDETDIEMEALLLATQQAEDNNLLPVDTRIRDDFLEDNGVNDADLVRASQVAEVEDLHILDEVDDADRHNTNESHQPDDRFAFQADTDYKDITSKK